jgi:hypothetical protein
MLPKAFDVTDPRADGDCLNVGDLTNDVKAHLRILAALANRSEIFNQRGQSRLIGCQTEIKTGLRTFPRMDQMTLTPLILL